MGSRRTNCKNWDCTNRHHTLPIKRNPQINSQCRPHLHLWNYHDIYAWLCMNYAWLCMNYAWLCMYCFCGCHFNYMHGTSDIYVTLRYFKHQTCQVFIWRGLSIKHDGLTNTNGEFTNNICFNNQTTRVSKRYNREKSYCSQAKLAKAYHTKSQNFCLRTGNLWIR